MTQESKTKILEWFKGLTIGQVLIAASLFTAAHSGYTICISIHDGVEQVQDAIRNIVEIKDNVRIIKDDGLTMQSKLDIYQVQMQDSLEYYRNKNFYYSEKYYQHAKKSNR
ncbi:MAG TPA: hypothetical protein VHA52_09055 [Candidatus Babeliaceae bacterium]|nr:hypothetical protein [Candidatus Babeliaceae bacterium]